MNGKIFIDYFQAQTFLPLIFLHIIHLTLPRTCIVFEPSTYVRVKKLCWWNLNSGFLELVFVYYCSTTCFWVPLKLKFIFLYEQSNLFLFYLFQCASIITSTCMFHVFILHHCATGSKSMMMNNKRMKKIEKKNIKSTFCCFRSMWTLVALSISWIISRDFSRSTFLSLFIHTYITYNIYV